MLCVRDVMQDSRTLALLGLKYGRLVLTALVYNHSYTESGFVYSFHALYMHISCSVKKR